MDVNLETLPIGEDGPATVNVVVEVPTGSRNKYEYDPELGAMLDRILPGNIRYPADYGFIPSTGSVAAYDPIFSGCVVRARVIGASNLEEAHEMVRECSG